MTPNVETLQKMARNRALSHSRAPVSRLNFLNGYSGRKEIASLGFAAFLAYCALAPLPSRAAETGGELAPMPVPMFARVRSLSLEDARDLAMKRSAGLSLSAFKIAAARAGEREVSRRIKVNTQGGLDPFSGKVRFYLALDLERLAGLNRAEKEGARQKVEQEKIGERSAREDAIKRVSTAWYSLTASQMALDSAARRRQSSRALCRRRCAFSRRCGRIVGRSFNHERRRTSR